MSKYNVYVEEVSVEAIFNILGGVEGARKLQRGELVVVPKVHHINTSLSPHCPKDWKVVEHQSLREIEWDSTKVELYLDPKQQSGLINGHQLRKNLKGKRVLNTTALDYLLKHPELIPEEWKDKSIFFWGTIYSGSDGGLCVRGLHWNGDRWVRGCGWLDYGFDDLSPAAVLAS